MSDNDGENIKTTHEKVAINEYLAIQQARPAPPFHVNVVDEVLTICFSEELNDAGWAAWFGSLQQALRCGYFNGNKFNTCKVDFSKCFWCDPLPLLALSISLLEFEKIKSGHVIINLPPLPSREERQHESDLRHKLLRFLAREGFLDLFCKPVVTQLSREDYSAHRTTTQNIEGTNKISDKSIGKKPENIPWSTCSWDCTDEQIAELKDLKVKLTFETATCLPAKVLFIEREKYGAEKYNILNEIEKWIDQHLSRSIEPVVSARVPLWAQGGVRYRLLTLLRECLHNVAEHAYQNSGFLAVYIRYREGRLGESPANWLQNRDFLKRELDCFRVPLMIPYRPPNAQNEVPHLGHDAFENTRSGFFEVYIIDAGSGLRSKLANLSNKPQSLSAMLNDIFIKGLSSKGFERDTAKGGLFLVRQFLEPVADYLRVYDGDEWWGTTLPLPTGKNGALLAGRISQKAFGVEAVGRAVDGLAWTARLSWREHTDQSDITVENPWCGLTADSDKTYRDKLLSVYKQPSQSNRYPIPVYDHRFSSPHLPYKNQFAKNGRAFKFKNSYLIVGLPFPSNPSKRSVQDWLINLITNDYFKPSDNLTIVIGEIPSIEAAVYLAAIEDAQRFTKGKLPTIDVIVLITRDLRVSILTRQKGLLRLDKSRTKNFLQCGEGNISESCLAYFEFIRHHDGVRFWEIAQQLPGAVINKQVQWTDGRTLDCYLDFPQTMVDPVCKLIYKAALERLLAVVSRHDCTLEPQDILVDSFVTRFRAMYHPRRRFSKSMNGNELEHVILQIGSVMVTGETALTIGKRHVFYFFCHPNGIGEGGRFLLPWLWRPVENVKYETGAADKYLRIGRSPIIAKGGWKAFSMPRFDDKGASIYTQSPKDSYRAWQEPSRPALRLGHWSYGGHHDFLTINMLRAYDTELDQISIELGGSLARFTLANLFQIFDLDKQHLNEEGVRLIDAIAKDGYKHIFPAKLRKSMAVLVYPSHPTTDHIIEKFMQLIIAPEKRINVQSRTISILPIRRARRGLGLQISGLTLERLKNAYGSTVNNGPPLVYFDDALITGRSFAEIKSLAHNLGYKEIYSLILLDRQRFPSARHVDGEHHLCFWRLDVPTLGSSVRCPLCQALKLSKEFTETLIDTVHKERIGDWQKNWSAVDPTLEWGDAGLKPIPLFLKKNERKFSLIEKDGNFIAASAEEQKIRLSNSAGVAAWMTEIQSITSRDDLYASIKDDPEIGTETKIQLLANQLLLFYCEMEGPVELELAKALWQALWTTPESDRHTAVAALTLICLKPTVLIEVIRASWTGTAAQVIAERNIDCRLLLAYAYHLMGKSSIDLPNGLRQQIQRLFTNDQRISLYYRLHRESKDELGKSHTEPLPRLFTYLSSRHLTQKDRNELSMCVDYLTYVAEKLQGEWCRNTRKNVSQDDDNSDNTEVANLQTVIRKLGTALRQKLLEKTNTKQMQVRDILDDVSIFLKMVDLLHQSVLFPLGVQATKAGKVGFLFLEIEELIADCNKSNEHEKLRLHIPSSFTNRSSASLLHGELVEAYVPWDWDVYRAIEHTLKNIRHANNSPEILDPWAPDNQYKNSGKSHGWVHLSIQQNYIEIIYRNLADSNKLDKVGNVGSRWTAQLLKKVNGTLHCRPIEETPPDQAYNKYKYIETVITLPFIHTIV